MASYYDLLGVKLTVSPDALRKAFRAAAKRVHPDARPGPADAMIALNLAYETLTDPARRAAYDRALAKGDPAAATRPAPGTLDAATYRSRVFLPLDRALAAALEALDSAVAELADDPFDDQSSDHFDGAVLQAAQALDRAFRGLNAHRWPAPLAPGLNVYREGIQQAEAALEDYFRFAQQYEAEVLEEGGAALQAASRLLSQARALLQA